MQRGWEVGPKVHAAPSSARAPPRLLQQPAQPACSPSSRLPPCAFVTACPASLPCPARPAACVGRVSSLQLASLGPNTAIFNAVFQVPPAWAGDAVCVHECGHEAGSAQDLVVWCNACMACCLPAGPLPPSPPPRRPAPPPAAPRARACFTPPHHTSHTPHTPKPAHFPVPHTPPSCCCSSLHSWEWAPQTLSPQTPSQPPGWTKPRGEAKCAGSHEGPQSHEPSSAVLLARQGE